MFILFIWSTSIWSAEVSYETLDHEYKTKNVTLNQGHVWVAPSVQAWFYNSMSDPPLHTERWLIQNPLLFCLCGGVTISKQRTFRNVWNHVQACYHFCLLQRKCISVISACSSQNLCSFTVSRSRLNVAWLRSTPCIELSPWWDLVRMPSGIRLTLRM